MLNSVWQDRKDSPEVHQQQPRRPSAPRHRSCRRGACGAFTLIEILVSISIIALLIGILVPSLGDARRQAKRSVCAANLHFVGLAATMYLGDSSGAYWPYYVQNGDGRWWWFGYEAGGPGSGIDRPLDKSQGALAPYLGLTDDRLQCPSFPYQAGCYSHKFSQRSASYGYNLHLVGRLDSEYVDRSARVFMFADGAHFDFGEQLNEGHYILYTAGASAPSGYAHFRHQGVAQVLYMDGHVAAQPLRGPAYRIECGGQAGNLGDESGQPTVYGF